MNRGGQKDDGAVGSIALLDRVWLPVFAVAHVAPIRIREAIKVRPLVQPPQMSAETVDVGKHRSKIDSGGAEISLYRPACSRFDKPPFETCVAELVLWSWMDGEHALLHEHARTDGGR